MDRHPLLSRNARAINVHDIDGLVAAFASDFCSEQPPTPQRAFQGIDGPNGTDMATGVMASRIECVASPCWART